MKFNQIKMFDSKKKGPKLVGKRAQQLFDVQLCVCFCMCVTKCMCV